MSLCSMACSPLSQDAVSYLVKQGTPDAFSELQTQLLYQVLTQNMGSNIRVYIRTSCSHIGKCAESNTERNRHNRTTAVTVAPSIVLMML